MTHLTLLNQPVSSGIISASQKRIVFHQQSAALLHARGLFLQITRQQTGSDGLARFAMCLNEHLYTKHTRIHHTNFFMTGQLKLLPHNNCVS